MTTENIERARDILELGMAEFSLDKLKWVKGSITAREFEARTSYFMAMLDNALSLLSIDDYPQGE